MIENVFPPAIGDKVRIIERKDSSGINMKEVLLKIFGKFPYEGNIVAIISYPDSFMKYKFPTFYHINGKTKDGKSLVLTYFRHEFEAIV